MANLKPVQDPVASVEDKHQSDLLNNQDQQQANPPLLGGANPYSAIPRSPLSIAQRIKFNTLHKEKDKINWLLNTFGENNVVIDKKTKSFIIKSRGKWHELDPDLSKVQGSIGEKLKEGIGDTLDIVEGHASIIGATLGLLAVAPLAGGTILPVAAAMDAAALTAGDGIGDGIIMALGKAFTKEESTTSIEFRDKMIMDGLLNIAGMAVVGPVGKYLINPVFKATGTTIKNVISTTKEMVLENGNVLVAKPNVPFLTRWIRRLGAVLRSSRLKNIDRVTQELYRNVGVPETISAHIIKMLKASSATGKDLSQLTKDTILLAKQFRNGLVSNIKKFEYLQNKGGTAEAIDAYASHAFKVIDDSTKLVKDSISKVVSDSYKTVADQLIPDTLEVGAVLNKDTFHLMQKMALSMGREAPELASRLQKIFFSASRVGTHGARFFLNVFGKRVSQFNGKPFKTHKEFIQGIYKWFNQFKNDALASASNNIEKRNIMIKYIVPLENQLLRPLEKLSPVKNLFRVGGKQLSNSRADQFKLLNHTYHEIFKAKMDLLEASNSAVNSFNKIQKMQATAGVADEFLTGMRRVEEQIGLIGDKNFSEKIRLIGTKYKNNVATVFALAPYVRAVGHSKTPLGSAIGAAFMLATSAAEGAVLGGAVSAITGNDIGTGLQAGGLLGAGRGVGLAFGVIKQGEMQQATDVVRRLLKQYPQEIRGSTHWITNLVNSIRSETAKGIGRLTDSAALNAVAKTAAIATAKKIKETTVDLRGTGEASANKAIIQTDQLDALLQMTEQRPAQQRGRR